MFGANKREKSFKDYCLILQVHPEADGAMVDAAYWHLAKRYNQAASYDPNAKAKLEELNEAYIVLGSPQRRDEYMKVRARVLGEGALPLAPGPAPSTPPLTVMTRQRPVQRTEEPIAPTQGGLSAGHFIASAAVVVALAVALLAIAVSPILALLTGVVFGAMLAGAALVLILPSITRRLFPPRKRAPPVRPTSLTAGGTDRRGTPLTIQRDVPEASPSREIQPLEKEQNPSRNEIEQIKEQSGTLASARGGEPRLAAGMRPETSDAPLDEAAEQPQGLSRDQIDQIKKQAAAYRRLAEEKKPARDDRQVAGPEFQEEHQSVPLAIAETPAAEPVEELQGLSRDQIDQIRKQAEAYRRAAQESAARDAGPPVGETRELDPAEIEKIRAQTERLKAIADKFNAAKAKGAPLGPNQT